MIKKELDPFVAEDKYAVAGRKAEEQMAFYLKRFFASSPDVFVLNGIRLEHADDAAQMDHLVLHRYGVIVVESKSVAGKIQIKDDGQWIRWYGKESSGMASPITQAKLQLRFMRDYLNLAVKPKSAFDRYTFDVQVAISDSGVILWPTTGGLPEVCKADQVAERIENRIIELENQPDSPAPWTVAHLSKIADFLCTSHRDLNLRREEKIIEKHQAHVENRIAAAQAIMETVTKSTSHIFSGFADAMVAQKAAAQKNVYENNQGGVATGKTVIHVLPHSSDELTKNVCKHCSSEDVSILFGRSYYFHCNVCDKNSPLKSLCITCGGVEMPHKKGKEFYLECKHCNTNRLFHVNG
ncbi:MAG: nuclease-related domain-containing protein [Proteobacteria bacterium]|nr:nuclease-related domain-containing protein [Pseudomonadota bacterium]